eukprot:scaffold9748_cov63-Phaeocystis_antarctica.AAC.1
MKCLGAPCWARANASRESMVQGSSSATSAGCTLGPPPCSVAAASCCSSCVTWVGVRAGVG